MITNEINEIIKLARDLKETNYDAFKALKAFMFKIKK